MTFGLRTTLGLLFLIGITGLTGCQTADQADTDQMASVEIHGHDQGPILKATAAAFLANGYQKVDELTFEKIGSAWETANYGGWSSDPVWIKVRVKIVCIGINRYTLGCDAYVVEGRGVTGVEIARKFMFAKRSECKKILREAKASLKAPPPWSGTVLPPLP